MELLLLVLLIAAAGRFVTLNRFLRFDPTDAI
jgi:hypothetical protein